MSVPDYYFIIKYIGLFNNDCSSASFFTVLFCRVSFPLGLQHSPLSIFTIVFTSLSLSTVQYMYEYTRVLLATSRRSENLEFYELPCIEVVNDLPQFYFYDFCENFS